MVNAIPSSENQQVSVHRPIPYLARIAGVKDDRVFYSEEMGTKGRKSLIASGWHKLVVPSVLAVAVSLMGFIVMGWAGLCFGPLFILANSWIQSILNPLISERRVVHGSAWSIAALTMLAYVLLLLSGTFAATLVAWFLFKSTVDQRHQEYVVSVMSSSQEKQRLTFAESALERERANLSNKRQVSTSAIEQAQNSYTQAQDIVAKANAAYQEEVAKGGRGRNPGDGPAAKALWKSLQDAKEAETKAKLALDESRTQATAPLSESPNLVEDYNTAKRNYEVKEKALIDAGPGMLKTFWWLLNVIHTEPILFLFVGLWAVLEASGVISHAAAGRNAYERARVASLQVEETEKREVQEFLKTRRKNLALDKAEKIATQRASKSIVDEAKDKSKG